MTVNEKALRLVALKRDKVRKMRELEREIAALRTKITALHLRAG